MDWLTFILAGRSAASSAWWSAGGASSAGASSAGASSASAAAAFTRSGSVELSDVADQLFEEGEFSARRRGRSGNRVDRSRVLYPFVIDCLDNPLVVKADDIYLLIKYIGFEESSLASSPTYIIPGFVIENTDA